MLAEAHVDVKTSTIYLIFSRALHVEDVHPPRCYVKTDKAKKKPALGGMLHMSSLPHLQSFEQTPRKYRLAVAATAEYVKKKDDGDPNDGDAVDDAIRAIVETVNMLEAVYVRDLGISFTLLVSRALVSTNTNDYANGDPATLLTQNQARLDKILGAGGYDVGHVFSTAGGGLAGVGIVCTDGQKGRGETGLDDPSGKYFAIDYVAHELGHEFGANHTFNGLGGTCTNDTRNGDTAFEPGSGSTIMSYAGNCDKENLQNEVDTYFHGVSLGEIFGYKTGSGSACGTALAPVGSPPSITLDGPSQYTIPRTTRFVLRAHPLSSPATFVWEEFYPDGVDITPAPPDDDSDGKIRPLFRSFEPSNKAFARYFPRLQSSLNQPFEKLPSLSVGSERKLLFRLTARNNSGRSSSADVNVRVVSMADDGKSAIGPFRVLEPSSAQTWINGTQQTVTWDIANTDQAPVSCQHIHISLLDVEEGNEALLKSGLPNNGSATFQVSVSPIPSGPRFVMVGCDDNIFFGLSSGQVTVTFH